MEKVHYKTCLIITGAIQEASRKIHYDELALHLLIIRRWRSKSVNFPLKDSKWLTAKLISYLDFSCQENNPLRSTAAPEIKPVSSGIKLLC